jgi:hypothetical protein
MIDPSVPQSRFENLAQRHDLLVHGAMRGRLAARRLALFKSMDAITSVRFILDSSRLSHFLRVVYSDVKGVHDLNCVVLICDAFGIPRPGVRTLGCADLFRIMAFSQLTWREQLRDIEACLEANQAKLFHMGLQGRPPWQVSRF